MAERLQRDLSTSQPGFQRLGDDLGAGEVIEVDYVTLDCRPMAERAAGAVFASAPRVAPQGIGMLRGDAGATPPGSRRAGAIFWLFGLVLIAASFWISGGHALISR